jgi:effector-binding domain-containing protein
MAIDVQLVETKACPTAVLRARTTRADLPETIGRLLDPVWAYLRAADLKTDHNVVLYRGDLTDSGGGEVEVGVQVDRPFTGAPDGIVAGELPAALVARAVHHGPYHRLGETHDAVVQWCRDHGHTLIGISWEVYGDWTDDVDSLETEVAHAVQR